MKKLPLSGNIVVKSEQGNAIVMAIIVVFIIFIIDQFSIYK